MSTIKKPAIFLDRDGVLTVEKSYVNKVEDMEIFPADKACVDKIHALGYLAIVITNQSGIGRGMFSEEELHRMNNKLMSEVGVDAVYYCPHWHHEKSNLPKYNVECNCRKPKTGMIDQSIMDFREKHIEIDISNSYFVGDRATDILTGQKAGVITVLVETGYGSARLEQEVTPDYICEDLKAFVEIISLGN